MLFYKRLITILLAILVLGFSAALTAQDQPKIQNKARLEWSNIEAASGYIIEIRQGGTRIVKAETKNNYYDAALPHGVYQFRVSVLNKKGEIETRTGWETVKVQSWNIVGKKYQYLSFGWSYNVLIPKWNETVSPTPLALHLHYEYQLPFDFFAVEADLEWEDYDNVGNEDEVNREMYVISFSPGICMYTRVSEYIDALFHLDTGLSYTNLDLDDRGDKSTVNSLDFFAMSSFGLRLVYDMYYIEHGIGYKQIFYKNENFRELRPFIRAGIRF